MPETDAVSMDFMEAALAGAGFEDEQSQFTASSNGNSYRPASFDAVAFLSTHGVRIKNTKTDGGGTTYVLEECPFDSSHKAPDSAVFVMPNGAIGFKCLHNSCANYKWRDLRTRLDPIAYDKPKQQPEHNSPGNEPANRLDFLTSAELADTDLNVPYIVDGVVAELQPTVVGGPSKAMKTGGLVDLLVSIQIGGHFVGYFPVVTKKRCWLISGESGQNVIAETADRVCNAAHHNLRDLGMIWGFKLPRLANTADVRELGRVIKGEGIGVLGVDPLYLSLDTDGKESSMFSMGSMLRPFSEVCIENGCTPILAHHFRQTIRDFSPPQLQDMSHAGIEQYARQWILLKRREAYKAGTGEHRLHLVTGGSAGHGGAYHLDISEGTRKTEGGRFWQTKVTTATEAIASEQEKRAAAAVEREQGRRVEHRQKIIEALRTFPRGETRKGLRTATGLNDTNFTTAIQELIHEGKVELCEVKKHTTTHDGYRLTTPQKVLCRDMVGHGESDPA